MFYVLLEQLLKQLLQVIAGRMPCAVLLKMYTLNGKEKICIQIYYNE